MSNKQDKKKVKVLAKWSDEDLFLMGMKQGAAKTQLSGLVPLPFNTVFKEKTK